jgi:GTP cyclohydrolase II
MRGFANNGNDTATAEVWADLGPAELLASSRQDSRAQRVRRGMLRDFSISKLHVVSEAKTEASHL